MQLREGEKILDEAKFLATNTSYAASLKGRAQETYQEKLERYYALKKEYEEPEPQNKGGAFQY